jgi:hypothetical protein
MECLIPRHVGTRKARCYYAHAMSLYNTPQEARDIALLEAMGYEVINPNTPYHSEQCSKRTNPMDHFFDVVHYTADLLAFRAMPDGSITQGVAIEIRAAAPKPVFELPSGVKRRTLTLDETRDYLAELGQR